MECYLKAITDFSHSISGTHKTLFGYLTISRIRDSNSFEARLNQGCVRADTDRLGWVAFLQNLNFAGRESGWISGPSSERSEWMCVTHKSTVVRTVICRQDGRGRFPVCWTTSPNVGQTPKENPNLVFYMTFTLNDIYKQYNKLHKHWYTKISSLRCAEDWNPPQKCIRHVYKIQAICRALQALYSPQRCDLIKKKKKKKKKKKSTTTKQQQQQKKTKTKQKQKKTTTNKQTNKKKNIKLFL